MVIFNWYQHFCLEIQILLCLISIDIKIVYLQLVCCLFTYQLVSRFLFFDWYSFTFLIGIKMHFIDTFLIGIIFVFRQKGGEHPLIDFLF